MINSLRHTTACFLCLAILSWKSSTSLKYLGRTPQLIFSFKPFHPPDWVLVLPTLVQDQADGGIEVEVEHLDDHHEHVVVEELGGCQVSCPIFVHLPNEASNHPHIGKVTGGNKTIAIVVLLSASISDGGDNADEQRQPLCIDTEVQESLALVGEGVFWPSCFGSWSEKYPPCLEAHGTDPKMRTETSTG